MPDTKPAFNPNKPYQTSETKTEGKPTFNPNAEFKAEKQYIPHIDNFNPSPSDNSDQLENTLNDIVKISSRSISDGEKDMLRDMLSNPKLTPEQAKESIQTLQGYHPKQQKNTITSPDYYVKLDDNGVLRPIPLGQGEKPPKRLNVSNVWGATQKESNDDSWYTDLSKSIFNALPQLASSAAELGQLGVLGVTGEESEFFKRAQNTAESLKLPKDESLDKQIYSTEGVNKIGNLVSKDRFDFSPAALWGTANSALESLPEFLIGAGEVGTAIKGAKKVYNVAKGIEGAVELGKAGQRASVFGASFLTQIGEGLETAEEAGLKGRDKAAFATAVTSLKASVDAFTGLDIGAKLFSTSFKKAEKDLIKGFAQAVEKDAEGMITEKGFKDLAKGMVLDYGKLASIGAKEIGKDVAGEMSQESLQSIIQKAGENIWDKITPEDRGRFGTDALSAKSFAEYLSNGINSLGVAPVSVLSANAKKKYNEQSINAFDTVQKGPEAVNELKTNIKIAKDKGNINSDEYDQAIFKVDAYQKYDEQTKDLNLDKKQKKKSFELSFNIEALKSEINSISKDDLEKLDPIGHAKIDSKKKIIKGLQEELNSIILKEDVQKETRVGQDTVDKVVKNEEPVEGQTILKKLLKDLSPPTPSHKTTTKTDVAPDIKVNERRANNPKFNELDSAGNAKFNTLRPLEKKEVLHDYFDEHPELNNEIKGKVVQSQNNVWKVNLGDGKFVQFASSIVPEQFVGNKENLEGDITQKKDSSGQSYVEYKTPVTVKLESIKADPERKMEKPLRILNVYNSEGKYIKSIKEKEKGNTEYYPSEIKQMQDIQEKGYVAPKISPKQQSELQGIQESVEQDELQNRELTPEETQGKLAEEETRFAYESQLEDAAQYQKESNVKDDFNKSLERIKKNFPKVKVVLDNKIKGAGQVKGIVLSINPDYAGLDTPIHEAGHILIDSIGYNNKVIQAAIKQLSGTKLWSETKELYPELNEEMFGKEVLAQAIGNEGASIFNKETDKSKFKTLLDYIFSKLKQLFGIDKNIAKSLAKQVISGINTKVLEGKNEQVQESKISADEKNDLDKLIRKINKGEDLSVFSDEQLLDVYNYIITAEGVAKGKALNNVMIKIAMNLFNRQVLRSSLNPEFSVNKAQDQDITYKDVKFKVLSHFTDAFPEMKELSKMWDSAYFAKVKESRSEKKNNEKLAIEVIKERNSKLGITDRVKELIQRIYSSTNHKYFDFLDNGNGQLLTLEEANKKGLSKAQKDYLKYVRELMSERENLIGNPDIYNMDMEIMRIDKKFSEAYSTEGLSQAYSNWLGTNDRLGQMLIEFKNPITNKTQFVPFSEAEKTLIEYGNKGIVEKAKSLALLTKYNFSARRKLKESPNKIRGEYLLDENGKLQSKFNKDINKSKSYSKDFYTAIQEYIDDNNHIKHISPLMPIINSIEYLNTKGAYTKGGEKLHSAKPNLVKWVNEWRDLHILKRQNEGIVELDSALKFLRTLTSATTMWFAVPANILNDAIGIYNNWREQGGKAVLKGNLRLFGGIDRKINSEYGFGVVNRYAVDIARKYGAVSTDVDSNPLRTGKNFFTELAYIGQKYGEFHIQASGLLGLMDEKDYNSFEYKTNKNGVEKLLVKEGIDEKALEERILDHINKVSDVQGKYSDKDRRNIMNNELGRAALQFKTWVPDWFRVRYGEEGSWRKMTRDGFKELRDDMQEKGVVKAFWENQAFMKNLRGAIGVALLYTLVHNDDEDKDKSEASKLLKQALADVLFIFDPNTLKFTLTRPVAAIGTVEKFVNAYDHLLNLDEYKTNTKYGDKGDLKLQGDILGLTPGKKILDVADMLNNED